MGDIVVMFGRLAVCFVHAGTQVGAYCVCF